MLFLLLTALIVQSLRFASLPASRTSCVTMVNPFGGKLRPSQIAALFGFVAKPLYICCAAYVPWQ